MRWYLRIKHLHLATPSCWPIRREQHKKFRETHGLLHREPVAALPGLTVRESDVAACKLELHKGPWPLVVDVSQSIYRCPQGARTIPTLTTSSKLVVLGQGGAQGMIGPEQKMRVMGLFGLRIPEDCAEHMDHMLGNGMHVDAVALAIAIGLAFKTPHAGPTFLEHCPVAFVKWCGRKNMFVAAKSTAKKEKKKKPGKKSVSMKKSSMKSLSMKATGRAVKKKPSSKKAVPKSEGKTTSEPVQTQKKRAMGNGATSPSASVKDMMARMYSS